MVYSSDPDIGLMTYVGYVADANSAVTTGTLLFPGVPGPRVDLKIKESKSKEGWNTQGYSGKTPERAK